MRDIEFSIHAQDMLVERQIHVEWVWRALNSPDKKHYEPSDGTTHYIKAIEECDNRVLRVVVNENVDPNRLVTVFFDRRLRGKP